VQWTIFTVTVYYNHSARNALSYFSRKQVTRVQSSRLTARSRTGRRQTDRL